MKEFIAEVSGSSREDEAQTDQVELGAANLRVLQQLEAVYLPLGLTAAPQEANGGTNGGSVLSEVGGEALDDAGTAGACLTQPHAEGRAVRALRTTPASDDPAEPSAKFDDLGRENERQLTGDEPISGLGAQRMTKVLPRKFIASRWMRRDLTPGACPLKLLGNVEQYVRRIQRSDQLQANW